MDTRLFLVALAAAAASIGVSPTRAFPAVGVPVTTNPGTLTGTGTGVTAIFVSSDAGDNNQLLLDGFAQWATVDGSLAKPTRPSKKQVK